MQTNHSAQENLQNSTETGHKAKSNLTTNIEKIEDTIFSIVNSPEEGWFLAIGHNKITDAVPTREEAIAKLESNEKWDIIFKICIIITEAAKAVDEDHERLLN